MFAEEGSAVAVLDLPYDRAKAAATEIGAVAGSISPYGVDVSDEASVARAVSQVVEDHGRIDVLVNGAAIIRRSELADVTAAEWRRVLDVNLTGTFLMCQEAVRHMPREGAIVNVGSINALRHNPSIVAYGVSKAGVAALTQALAVALAPKGIRVNAVVGGHVLTDFSRARLADPVIRARVESSIPLGHLGDPSDFATAIRFLADPASAWITGAMVPVDGGWSAADTTALAGHAG